MKIIFLLCTVLLGFQAISQTKADDIIGLYWTPQKNGKIEVFKSGGEYYGKLSWIKDAAKLDDKNPEPALRKRKLLNMIILTKLNYYADNREWQDGKIYDAESGKTYKCKAWLDGSDLMLRGYVGVSLIGRTEKFTRIK